MSSNEREPVLIHGLHRVFIRTSANNGKPVIFYGILFYCVGSHFPTNTQMFDTNKLSDLTMFITDKNECLINNGGCDPDATCINTPGSFICLCDDGYEGTGTDCYGEELGVFKS